MEVAFHTLGCKVNQYETQAMRKLLTEQGYDTQEFVPGDTHALYADVLVINSCTVTGESDRKLRQLLRRCRRDLRLRPHLRWKRLRLLRRRQKGRLQSRARLWNLPWWEPSTRRPQRTRNPS